MAARLVEPKTASRVTGRWILALPLAVFFLAGCSGETTDARGAEADDAGRTIRVETLVLEPTRFEDRVQITGTVAALDDATLSAQTAGTVVSLLPLGRSVAAGALVAQLDPSLAQSALEQAEAALESAQAHYDLAADNLKRNEPLYRDSVISAIEFENVRAGYNQARAGLSQARAALSQTQEQLRQTRVTAPFGGVVEAHFVEVGEQVTPGRQIARIINTNRVKVKAGVPERYAGDVRNGTSVVIEFQALQGQAVAGTVSFAGSAIDPQSRTFPIEVLVDNRDGTLKPEMIAQVSVTRRQIDDAIVVPRAAIVRDEDGTSVFLTRRENGRTLADKRSVVLGPTYGNQAVITNLQPGDEVVVLGQANLNSGDRLQIMQQHTTIDVAPGGALSNSPPEGAAPVAAETAGTLANR